MVYNLLLLLLPPLPVMKEVESQVHGHDSEPGSADIDSRSDCPSSGSAVFYTVIDCI